MGSYADSVELSVNGSYFYPLPCAAYAPITKIPFSGNGDVTSSFDIGCA